MIDKKLIRKRVQQLALVRELMNEDQIKSISLNLANEQEINRNLIRELTTPVNKQQELKFGS